MARKKPAEDHENLERWLVSYADFMTLLFATFVVLYALAQSDVNAFKSIEEALKRAFTQNIFENQQNIMEGSDSILEGERGATNPLMLEYMSQKYEQSAFEDVQKNIDDLKKEGIATDMDERGLVIRLDSKAVNFAPGSADLTKEAMQTLDKVAKIIKEKFAIHYIQVEGHTDSDPISSSRYISNWELSAARACTVVRYFIKAHEFNNKIFIATGLADTIPIVENNTPNNKSKNRRIEIIILKNKNKYMSKKNMQQILEETKLQQKKKQSQYNQTIEGLVGDDREILKNVIDMSNTYESETKRLDKLDELDYTDGIKPDFLEQQ